MNSKQINVRLYTNHLPGEPDNTIGIFHIENDFKDIWDRIRSFIKKSFPESACFLTFYRRNEDNSKFLDLEISHGEPNGRPTRINGAMLSCAGILTIHEQFVVPHESFANPDESFVTYDNSVYFIPIENNSELQSVSAQEAKDFTRKAFPECFL